MNHFIADRAPQFFKPRSTLMVSLLCVASALHSSEAQADQWKWHWKLNACSSQKDCVASERCESGTCYPTYSIVPMSDPSSGHPAKITSERYEQMVHDTFKRWTSDVTACTMRMKVFYAGKVSLNAGDIATSPTFKTTYVQIPSNWSMGGTVLGYTSVTSVNNNSTLIAANVLMNPGDIWFDGPSTNNMMSGYSFEQTLTHEIGHYFGITHTTSPPTAIMYARQSGGIRKLNLTRADLEDMCGLYPPSRPALGQGCSEPEQANDCAPSMECLASQADGGRRICTTPCADESGSCSDKAYSCRRAGAGVGEGKFACFLSGPPTDLCKSCTTDSACQSGMCAANPRPESANDAGVCVLPCNFDEDCGPNEMCRGLNRFEDPTGPYAGTFCQPYDYCRSYRCVGDAGCFGADQCLEGICIAPSKLGESCARTNTCAAGLTCATSGTAKICKQDGKATPLGCTCSTGPGLTDLFWLPAAFLLVRRMRKHAKS